ncbi:MAG: YraN family protein [Candidatus Liptonbacteria bacterium]|nr:YraN family protein [Candidatus Liptonbacteria bacterium]
MTKRSELGNLGEDIACEYLKNKKYKILARNYRKPWGEIDVVAKAKDKTLVFVEVKTVKESGSAYAVSAENQMTPAKINKFKRVAQLFAGEYKHLINEKIGSRLDVLAITLPYDAPERTLVELLNIAKINHYENI